MHHSFIRRSRPWVHAAVLLAALLLPSTNSHLLNGLPFSRPAEFLVLAVLLPVALSTALRRFIVRRYRRAAVPAATLALGSTLLVVAAKLVLATQGTAVGFAACYATPADPARVGTCERSYELPFSNWTRNDTVIRFSDNWNLPFVNSNRFNYYERGQPLRSRLPIVASWRGTLSREVRHLRIEYTGDGAITVDNLAIPMPREAEIGIIDVDLPPATSDRHFRATYRFDDGYVVGMPEGRPYARLLIDANDAEGRPTTLATSPAAWQRLTGIAIDLTLLLQVLWLAAQAARVVFVRSTRPVAIVLGLSAGVLAALLWAERADAARLVFITTAVALLALVRGRWMTRRFCLAWAGTIGLVLLLPDLGAANYASVIVAQGGNDPLTYESFARTILETGSLRAGEASFYYQILFRYIRFVEHVVFGDGHPLIAMFGQASIVGAVLWASMRLTLRGTQPAWMRATGFLGAASTLALLLSPIPVNVMMVGLSEYPTWILLPLFVGSAFGGRHPQVGAMSAILAALLPLTRMNQLPAIASLVGLAVLGSSHRIRAAVVAGSVITLLVVVLPTAHNYHYGNRLTFVPRSATIPGNLILPPAELLSPRPNTVEKLQDQLRGVTNTRDGITSLTLTYALPALPWMLTLIGLLVLGPRRPLALALLAVPLLFLAVHVPYQVGPRHVTAGYASMGIVALAALRLARPRL